MANKPTKHEPTIFWKKKDVLPDLNPGPLAPQVNSLPPE